MNSVHFGLLKKSLVQDMKYFTDIYPLTHVHCLGFPVLWEHLDVLYEHCCVHGVNTSV